MRHDRREVIRATADPAFAGARQIRWQPDRPNATVTGVGGTVIPDSRDARPRLQAADRLLAQLEADNARLRAQAVELALQIRALSQD